MVSSDKIVMMEDHDKAYHAWKKHDASDRILVHVDAHIDFGWIPEMDMDEINSIGTCQGKLLLNPFMKSRKKMVNIGNYICPAIRDGMVKKFYWVVPDETWKNTRGIRQIVKQLKQLLSITGCGDKGVEIFKDHIRCRILGKDVIVCALEGLPRIEEPVLLDIDVDFMLTPRIWNDLDPGRYPWIFPDQLFRKLAQKIGAIDLLTIAYSVEGGFTPLRFKYLGDELQALYQGESSERMRTVIQYKREALISERQDKINDAQAALQGALRFDENDASIYFNLSILNLNDRSGNPEQAAHFYHEAIRRDRTYATAYNNYGILYLLTNNTKRAEEEYKKFLLIDGENFTVMNGLGYIALLRRRYDDAEKYFDRAVSLNKNYPDARRGKSITCLKTGKFDEAENLFSGLRRDLPDDPEICWYLGLIAEKRGDNEREIAYYKDAVMSGGDGLLVHLKLIILYVKTGNYYRAAEEMKRIAAMTRAYFS